MLYKILDLLLGKSNWFLDRLRKESWDSWREGRALERTYILNDIDSIDPHEQSADVALDTLAEYVRKRSA